MTRVTKRAKALDITQTVKWRVARRDNFICIICKSPYGRPNAHYISRAHGGLGIERNIVTLCIDCHHKYDQTTYRPQYKEYIKNYLSRIYKDWNEEDLVYKKNDYTSGQ